ncbi:hypothetical protein V6N11_055995 [Hibiscus sabdariffa]|uniref:Uncharacterized protein n=1 Tax=Hibiscus sabdariffa TaxID=183260 RepID=A0ABR2T3C9_9ROSI
MLNQQQHSRSHNQADGVGHNTPVHQRADEINEKEEGIHVEESGNDLAATLPTDVKANQEVLSAGDESGNDLATGLSNQEVLSANDETNTPEETNSNTAAVDSCNNEASGLFC